MKLTEQKTPLYIQAMTQDLIYPKKYKPRRPKSYEKEFSLDFSKIEAQVMQEAHDAGFNVKSIAWYFGYKCYSSVYRRIMVKKEKNENL